MTTELAAPETKPSDVASSARVLAFAFKTGAVHQRRAGPGERAEGVGENEGLGCEKQAKPSRGSFPKKLARQRFLQKFAGAAEFVSLR